MSPGIINENLNPINIRQMIVIPDIHLVMGITAVLNGRFLPVNANDLMIFIEELFGDRLA